MQFSAHESPPSRYSDPVRTLPQLFLLHADIMLSCSAGFALDLGVNVVSGCLDMHPVPSGPCPSQPLKN